MMKNRPTTRTGARSGGVVVNRRGILIAAIAGAAGVATSPACAAGDIPKPVAATTDGLAPQLSNLKKLGPDRQVRAIAYRNDVYRVMTTDGQSAEFLEANLRFRIDSSDAGPLRGQPVILPTGTVGDRASVFFASPDEISAFIKHES